MELYKLHLVFLFLCNEFTFLFGFLFLLMFYGCAHVVAPSGGKKDSNPPKIVSISSLKNNETHKVQFVFDEFFLLND